MRRTTIAFLMAGLMVTGGAYLPAQGAEVKPAAATSMRNLSGWIPYWDLAAVDRAVANPTRFESVSAFWWTTSDGKVVKADLTESKRVAALAKLSAAKIPVWASVTDSSGKNTLASSIATPAGRAKIKNSLVALATSNPALVGVDLDWETWAFTDAASTLPATRKNWVKFVTELSAALHAKGKKLSVTIPGATSDRQYNVYAPETLGVVADEVRVMAYDYSWDSPGPIGPDTWWVSVHRYMASKIPPAKIRMGVADYGRDWAVRDSAGKVKVSGVCPDDASFAKFTVESSNVVAKTNQRALGKVAWTRSQGELKGTYLRRLTGTRKVTVNKKVTVAVPASKDAAGKTVPAHTVVKLVPETSTISATCDVSRVVWVSDGQTVASRAAQVATPVAVWQLSNLTEADIAKVGPSAPLVTVRAAPPAAAQTTGNAGEQDQGAQTGSGEGAPTWLAPVSPPAWALWRWLAEKR